MNTAADIVATIRRSRLLSMNTLADLAGIPASTISRIETGKIEPTFSMLTRIAEAAGFMLDSQLKEMDSDQPIAGYLERLSARNDSLESEPTKNLLAVASLALVTKRQGAVRLELTGTLQDAIRRMTEQGQTPIVSAIEAFSGNMDSLQSFIPIIYVDDPSSLLGFEAASIRSSQVLIVLPATDNVRENTRSIKGVRMVSPEWGILDALASPGRQPDAALEALAALEGAAA
jgi:transcriptional regulator with XRE-family HTH domain